MRNSTYILASTILALSLLGSSCLKSEECMPNVFVDDGLFMDINIDGWNIFVSDSLENHIFPGQNYRADTSRTDTMIFNFHCYYVFEGGREILNLSVVEYANFSDIADFGLGNLNYLSFDNLIYEGDFEYTDRSDSIPDYGINVNLLIGDSAQYFIDTSAHNPEDFYFNVDSYYKSFEKDCYHRRFEWITYSGTFGCRLVDPLTMDTVIITDGVFKSVAAQYQ